MTTTVEFSKNGAFVEGVDFLIPQKGAHVTATAVLDPQAVALAERMSWIDRIKATTGSGWAWVSGKARAGARATRLDKAYGFARKYLGWGWRQATRLVRTAGPIPLAVLTATSRTGQRAVGWTVDTTGSLLDTGLRFTGRLLRWGLRTVFRTPGARLAAAVERNYNRLTGQVLLRRVQAGLLAGKYLNPSSGHTRIAKAISYAWITYRLLTAASLGVWTIPVAVVALGVGIGFEPALRDQFAKRVRRTATSMEVTEETRREVQNSIDKIVSEYGPDMGAAPRDAQSDYLIRQGLLKHIDGDENPFEGLTAAQRKKAEKLYAELTAAVAEAIAHETAEPAAA